MKNFKRLVGTAAAATILMANSVFATTIMYNGSVIPYADQEPIIENSRTYVAVRDVFEALGFTVDWNANDKQAILSKDGSSLIVDTINNKLIQGDNEYILEDKVIILNGRTMLPLRQILETAGYTIEWDADTKTVTIIDAASSGEIIVDDEIIYNEDAVTFDNYFDETKPVGELTDEERAFLTGYYAICDEIAAEYAVISEKYLNTITGSDADVDNAAIIAEFSAQLDKLVEIAKKVEELEAPEGLEEFKNKTVSNFEGLIELFDKIVDLAKKAEGSEEGLTEEEQAAFFGEMLMFSQTANDYAKLLLDFYVEKNIDFKAEFGVEYGTIFDCLE